MQQLICPLTELTDPGCFAFTLNVGEQEVAGFVLLWQGRLRAYRNSCPHTGVTLNWAEDQFFDVEQHFIQCSMHGALFQPLDGLCLHGPCVGEQLTPLDVKLVDGQVILTEG